MSDNTSTQAKLSEFCNLYNPIVQTILLAVIGFTLITINSASNRTTEQEMWRAAATAGHAIYEVEGGYRWFPPVHAYESEIQKFKDLAILQSTYVTTLEKKLEALEGNNAEQARLIEDHMIDGMRANGLELVVEEPDATEGSPDEATKKKWFQFWKTEKHKGIEE